MPVAAWLSGPLRPVVEELFTREKPECDGRYPASRTHTKNGGRTP